MPVSVHVGSETLFVLQRAPDQTLRGRCHEYLAAVAYVEVETAAGDRGIGTAFHIGEGLFVTARHVVENVAILSVGTTMQSYGLVSLDELETRLATIDAASLQASNRHLRGPLAEGFGLLGGPDVARDLRVAAGTNRLAKSYAPALGTLAAPPYLSADGADVAILRVTGIDAPCIPLGTHLDDWLDNQFVLTRAAVLGYPPVPLTQEPVLMAAIGEVNAIIDPTLGRHPNFVLSVMPRGGFSGGPALSEWGFALGLVTHSLLKDRVPEELGYLSVLSVEPILNCLTFHEIMPRCVQEEWLNEDGQCAWYHSSC